MVIAEFEIKKDSLYRIHTNTGIYKGHITKEDANFILIEGFQKYGAGKKSLWVTEEGLADIIVNKNTILMIFHR